MEQLPKPDAPAWIWAKLLAALALLGVGLFGWLTGVNPKLDRHDLDIETLKVEVRQQGRQLGQQGRALERLESKIDRLLEKQP